MKQIRKTLFLIDGHSLCYRSFYAIRELATSKGEPTNAVYGFVNTFRKILREFNPDYMVVCFDSKEKTHRAQKYIQYKIQRPMMPENLIKQIPIIKDAIDAFNVKTCEVPGYEADDIIATLTQNAMKEEIDVVIVTEDKDMYQLANEHTKFFSASKDQMFSKDDVAKKLGFDPRKIIDFIALAGDAADNIPGVKGIGEVTAKQLIDRFGDLESILKNAQKVESSKIREKLIDQTQIAQLSKELATLDYDVPLDFKLEDVKVHSPNQNRLHNLFKDLEFRRLADEFIERKIEESNIEIHQLKIVSEFKDFIFEIKKINKFGYQILKEEEIVYVCINNKDCYQFGIKDLEKLKEVFDDVKILKITYNCKEMYKFLSLVNIESSLNTFDVMLSGYLISPTQTVSDISQLAWSYLKKSLPQESNKALYETAALIELEKVLTDELKQKEIYDLYKNIEKPLAYVLSKIESYGVKIDEDLLLGLSKECALKIEQLTQKLYAFAQEEFNVNSPKQLSVILFEKLKLPVGKKTKTGYSTDEEVLVKLAAKHEFPALLLEYRQLAKLKSTYIDSLPKLIDARSGRIHTEFNQIGAETGRLSSKHPNLQNIPIRTELGRQIRKAFICGSSEMILISADYSQVELRILAHLSGDENLKKAFLNNLDIHAYTASLIFDIKESEVDYDKRDTAKRVNFGIVYGMSSYGLSKDLGISAQEAQDFIDRYFARYPKVKTFMDDQIKLCEEKGFVSTLLNRRRYIPEIHSRNNAVKQFAQRQAINTPVQGSAADLMKLAMINIQQEIEKKKLQSKMMITVHDELVFDVYKNENEAMIALIREGMENPYKLSVPIKVDIKVGKNWLDMEKIKQS